MGTTTTGIVPQLLTLELARAILNPDVPDLLPHLDVSTLEELAIRTECYRHPLIAELRIAVLHEWDMIREPTAEELADCTGWDCDLIAWDDDLVGADEPQEYGTDPDEIALDAALCQLAPASEAA